MSESPLLSIEQLRVSFVTRTSDVRAVDGVDLEIQPGEVLGLVGESGSGKSVTARSIMRLVPMPPGKLVSGRILFHDLDLTSVPEREMEDLRGSRIAMIFQDPMTFLNPLLTAGEQVS
jgi:peptide/nickel transport system ATP-binding protein